MYRTADGSRQRPDNVPNCARFRSGVVFDQLMPKGCLWLPTLVAHPVRERTLSDTKQTLETDPKESPWESTE